MKPVKCGVCSVELEENMEMIDGGNTHEVYCSDDCANIAFYEHANATTLYPYNKKDQLDQLAEKGYKVVEGKIYEEE